MRELERAHWRSLRPWLVPDRPGAMVGLHSLATGLGAWWVDRWPEPRAAAVFVGGNLALLGDAWRLDGEALGATCARLLARDWDRLFIDVPHGGVPHLRSWVPDLVAWERVVYERDAAPPPPAAAAGARVRRLGPGDAGALAGLSADVAWIADTTGGPAGLAARELAWGAFVGGRLASVAAPFYLGERYEDLGVVTEAEFRGRGLSPACAAGVLGDVGARGRRASWSTSPDNAGSRRVAEKLGFVYSRNDVLYVAGGLP